MAPATHDIMAEFNAQVDRCERKNYQGRAFYHPVAQIKEWMLAGSNLGKLLRIAYPRGAFAGARAEDISKSVIVFAILLRLGHGHLIHVFQQQFDDNNLDATPNEYLTTRLSREYPGVLDEFDQERWAFNPAKIEDMCNHAKAYTGGRWILPFCRREFVGGGGTAAVYGVTVPEDLVPDRLKDALLAKDPSKGYEFQDKDFGLCYQFAIKTYHDEYRSVFETETRNFGGIRGLPGVVECFGWYTEEFEENGQPQTTHNILLEYGDEDLDEYLALKYPPVLNSEIIAFWENVFGVAATLNEVHNFSYEDTGGDTVVFDGWHGDVKPSNILFAQGKFKLADFGFAKFEPNSPGKRPETSLDGVTHTYGAPECDPGRVKRKTRTPHTQKIDTWSFGCLLSSVATWVVLGSFAYEQHYPRVRKLAIDELIEKRKSEGNREEPKALDGFHDGREVLQAVKSWHQYLRNSIRKSDSVTEEVIILIEDGMLRSRPDERLSFRELVRELNGIIARAKRRDVPKTPAETLKALLMLDDMAPPDVNLQARLSESQSRRALALDVQSRPHTTRAKKTERLEEMVVPAKVAGRRRALESELRSRGESYTPPAVFFERTAVLTDSPLTKAAEINREPAAPLSLPPPLQGRWQRAGTPPATAAEEKIPVIIASPEEFESPDSIKGKSPARDKPAERSPVYDSVRSSVPSDPFAPHVNQSRQEPPSAQEPNRSRHSLFATRSTLTSINEAHGFDHYPIFKLRAKLDKEWSSRSIVDKLRHKIPADEVLKDFIQQRDIKFLVDNGWTMLEHWPLAEYVLVTLAMKIGALDDDGLDLYFTRGNYKAEGVKGSTIRTAFTAEMSDAKARDDPNMFQTQMAAALRRMLVDYRQDKSKKLTIIVLTTGVWEREDDSPQDVEEVLAKAIGDMNRTDSGFRKERRFTVEFVSFGENAEGLNRLRDLDDNFGKVYNIPDVIDTEPWYGDPDKMLIGSFTPAMDRQDTLVPSDPRRSRDGASGHLDESASHTRYRDPSPLPGPKKSTTSLWSGSDSGSKKLGKLQRLFG